jgi:hypothetical protein
MENAYPKIQKVTNLIKGNMSFVYGIYAISYLSNMILPRLIPKLTMNSISNKFTLAFSNVPGPIKPFFYYGSDGKKI